MDDGHDRSRRRKPDQCEPTPVEEGLELTEVETEPDEAPSAAKPRMSRRNGAVHPQRRLNRPRPASFSRASEGRYLTPGDHRKASAAPQSPVARVSVPW